MGTFRVGCTIGHIVDRARSATLDGLLVDTGSEYTWVPEKVLESLGIDREKKDLAEDLVFEENYLGKTDSTFTLNFSTGSAMGVALLQ